MTDDKTVFFSPRLAFVTSVALPDLSFGAAALLLSGSSYLGVRYRLVGDVDFKEAIEVAAKITPVGGLPRFSGAEYANTPLPSYFCKKLRPNVGSAYSCRSGNAIPFALSAR